MPRPSPFSPSFTIKNQMEGPSSLSLLQLEVNHDVIPANGMQWKSTEYFWKCFCFHISPFFLSERQRWNEKRGGHLQPQVTKLQDTEERRMGTQPRILNGIFDLPHQPWTPDLQASCYMRLWEKKIKHFKLLLDSLLFAAKSFKATSRKITNGFNHSMSQFPHLYNKMETITGLIWSLSTYYWQNISGRVDIQRTQCASVLLEISLLLILLM